MYSVVLVSPPQRLTFGASLCEAESRELLLVDPETPRNGFRFRRRLRNLFGGGQLVPRVLSDDFTGVPGPALDEAERFPGDSYCVRTWVHRPGANDAPIVQGNEVLTR